MKCKYGFRISFGIISSLVITSLIYLFVFRINELTRFNDFMEGFVVGLSCVGLGVLFVYGIRFLKTQNTNHKFQKSHKIFATRMQRPK